MLRTGGGRRRMLRRPMSAAIASAFADISLAQLALIAGMALVASVIGGGAAMVFNAFAR